MRPRRRVRQSVDSVLAEERREWERQSLPRGPVRDRPQRNPPRLTEAAWRFVPALGSAAAGVAGGHLVGERPTGAAGGVVLALLWLAAMRRRPRVEWE